MLKDITLGQYFPGKSPIHMLDPRTKLIMLVVYIVALFIAANWVSYGLMLLFLIAVVKISTIPVKSIVKGMKPLVMILVFTGVLNLFFTTEGTTLIRLGFIHITVEGLSQAVHYSLRLMFLVVGTSLLTLTTSPISLTDGLERLLAPLKAIKLPVHEFSMMMSIALRFIPTIMEEAEKIMAAQKARGAGFTEGNLINVSDLRRAMKPKVLKRMREKDSRLKKFKTAVVKQIDQGIPLIWGVTLGYFPEPEIPQAFGGHMRLIIGYNLKTQEILYSDTWGVGHELKRMPTDWAFTITHDAFFLKPL